MPSSRRQLAIATFLGAAATLAHAQFGGGGGAGRGGRRGRGEDGEGSLQRREGDAAANAPSRRERLSNALLDARVRLLVTPAQGPAWEAFHAAFSRASGLTASAATSAPMDAAGASQAMQQLLSAAQNRYTLAESLADALKALLAQLDPQQQRTADQVLPGLLAEGLGARPAGAAAPR